MSTFFAIFATLMLMSARWSWTGDPEVVERYGLPNP
jgi:hypothetical protein